MARDRARSLRTDRGERTGAARCTTLLRDERVACLESITGAPWSLSMQELDRVIRPATRDAGTVRCAVQDHVVSNLPVPVALFFEQTLDHEQLASALAEALDE